MVMILEIEDKYYEIDETTYKAFLVDQPPTRTIDSKLNSIIANTIQGEAQLQRIEKHFRAHMIRQITLEHELQQTLEGMTNGNKQRD